MRDVPIKMEENDCSEIERLYYESETLFDILNRMIFSVVQPENIEEKIKEYTTKYTKAFMEYDKYRKYVETKYAPEGGFQSWEVNFNTREIIFHGVK